MKTIAATIAGLALAATSLLAAPSAQADAPKTGGYGCVDTYEWSHLQTDLDSPNGGARRAAVEQTWDVLPTGYRNQYFDPANGALYSLAYNFCQNPEVMIVMVYRKTSGAWQVALKGGFLPA